MTARVPTNVAFVPASQRTPDDWRTQAICEAEDAELFYPVSFKGQTAERQIAEAKAFCRRCPVSANCLDWALETRDQHAVAGGTTPAERNFIQSNPRLRVLHAAA